ncbi:hypothetical protein GIB67_019766 [Kingdonia uniflora]|uniref:Replication factor A C-terminal domain-containing protein n=1 Tax=Kingdonia uniflora TaxID=39325 RepID=A0A7J7MKC6_9MAGN|nr:hypothetical protein GIB67_019766 [Kingdonia uniflora]
MYDFGNKKDINRIEMLLIDEKGDQIHAIIYKKLVSSYEKTLQEGIFHLSSTMSTKLYFNLPIPEVINFKDCSIEGHVTSITNATSNSPSKDESMFKNRKTILEIKDINDEQELKCNIHEMYFSCNVVITKVLNDTTWFYMSCGQCKKKIVKAEITYWCPSCNLPVSIPIPRYCLRLKIEDNTGYLIVIAFENEAETLTKTPDEEHDTAFSILDNMIGTRWIFQIKIKRSNTNESYSSYTLGRVFPINEELEMSFNLPLLNKGRDDLSQTTISTKAKQIDEIGSEEAAKYKHKKRKLKKLIYDDDNEQEQKSA